MILKYNQNSKFIDATSHTCFIISENEMQGCNL